MTSTLELPKQRTIDVSTGLPVTAPTDSKGTVALRVLGKVGQALGSALFTLGFVVVVWYAVIKLFDVDSFVGKTPIDVWNYMFTDPAAAANRSGIFKPLGRTAVDAGIGFVGGLVAASLVALIFVILKPIEQTFLPVAVLVRSIPLVAMTPVLTLIFGRGLVATGVISGMVVFFPALVTLSFGLRATSRQASDLCWAFGASKMVVARKVMFPSALPSLFASARIGVPGAVIGALLAEWLATGKGLGNLMLTAAVNSFDYTALWAAVVVLTVSSVIVYYIVAAAESIVLTKFGPAGR